MSDDPVPTREGQTGRSMVRTALRLIRNATIAIALCAAVPIGLVMWRGDSLLNGNANANSRAKLLISERVRALQYQHDPSITLAEANRAFNAIQKPAREGVGGVQERDPGAYIKRVWDSLPIPVGAFPDAQPTNFTVPGFYEVIRASARGFSPAEMNYLRAIAQSPIWREVDIVAHAPAIDPMGARFKVPFDKSVGWFSMPPATTSAIREIAYASAPRAAWFLANGQRDSAVATFRMMISAGFAIIDNAPTMFDQLLGGILVAAGRDGLRTTYEVLHDPNASRPELAVITKDTPIPSGKLPTLPPEQARARLLAMINDPRTSRAERFESIHNLQFLSCTNTRELLIGPGDDVQRAVQSARNTLARFPSEQMLIDRSSLPPLSLKELAEISPFATLATSSAAVAGAVLHNDRMPLCAVVLAQNFVPF